jgi:Type II secretion system (T2SS), protein E, N-terminal domain
MPLSEIALALVRRGVVTRAAAIEAEQRKKLYGGGLDTALLELRASDEETLTSQLAEIIGIPLAPPQILKAVPDRAAGIWLDAATAKRIGAVPRAKQADVLYMFVWPEHDHDAMVKWSAEHAVLVEPALVCEVRFRAHAAAIYDLPLSPRYLALLAKLVGTTAARVLTGDRGRSDLRTPTPVTPGVDAVETLLVAARLGEAAERQSALRRLSRRLQNPRVIAFRHALQKKASGSDITTACGALRALAELRDKNAIPAIAELLEAGSPEVAKAAHAALVQLTCDDLGTKAKRWLDVWNRMSGRSRVEWLLEALAHRNPELRLQASSELYEISGEYFGYHYDLPERDREEARQRWIAWWQDRHKHE